MNRRYTNAQVGSKSWSKTVFLSERDLGLTVPINFVTNPGVSLTSTCFSQKKYDDKDFRSCFGNILSLRLRRLEIDIYWDEVRRLFSLCPVIISSAPEISAPSENTTSDSLNDSLIAPFSSSFTASNVNNQASNNWLPSVTISQTDSESTANSNTEDISLSTVPYTCSRTLTLASLIEQLVEYLRETDTILEAHIIYIILNLNVATSTSSFNSSESNPPKLPNYQELIGRMFPSNLTSYLYTPTKLESDRQNLNESWYKVNPDYKTTSDYYDEDIANDGFASSSSGWPGEGYIEFALGKRVLFGWGSIDSSMSKYNFSGDSDTIFSSDYLTSSHNNVSITSTGDLIEGCSLQNKTQNSLNTSWAIEPMFSNFKYSSGIINDITPLLNLTSRITGCGISPFLNTTLNTTAKKQNQYHAFMDSTSWSWAPNEPRKYPKFSNSNYNSSNFRCTTSQLNLSGRWTVSDCSEKNFSACRALGQPHNWTLSLYPTSFDLADKACPKGYLFTAPRTALENTHLTLEMSQTERNWSKNVKCWVAFQSLDVEGCWVLGKSNTTCRYVNDHLKLKTIHKRTIMIPTVAAILILIFTVFIILAKAASNRKEGRKERRHALIAYEGVPR